MSAPSVRSSRVLVRALGSATLAALAACASDAADPGEEEGDPPPAEVSYTLDLSIGGSGAAVVSSDDGALTCEGACSQDYPAGTTVTLTAQLAPGSGVAGWSGDCAGTGACVVTLDRDRSVELALVGGRLIDGRVVEAPDTQAGFAVAIADDGSSVVAGRLSGSVQIGASYLAASGTSDLLLVRYSAGGEVVWARRYGTAGMVVPEDLIIVGDAIYVTGLYDQATNLGSGPLPAPTAYDGFSARYDLIDGDPVWTVPFGTAGDDEGVAIEMAQDYLLVTATLEGPNYQLAVLAQNPETGLSGAVVLSKGPGVVIPMDSALTPDDGLIIVGRFNGKVSFDGGTTYTNSGAPGLLASFVARYDATVVGHEWTRTDLTQDGQGAWARSVVVEPDGDLVVVGSVSGQHDFGDGATPTESWDGFTMGLTSQGALRWSRLDPGAGVGNHVTAALGPDGAIYVGGDFAGETRFAGETALAAGYRDALVERLDPEDGALVWWNQLGGDGDALPWQIAADPAGVRMVGGTFGELEAGGVMGGSGVAGDLFIAHFGR